MATKNDYLIHRFFTLMELAFQQVDLMDSKELKYEAKRAYNQVIKDAREFHKTFRKIKDRPIKATENGIEMQKTVGDAYDQQGDLVAELAEKIEVIFKEMGLGL